MGNKIAIVSPLIPEICDKLKYYGYKLIYTEKVGEFISYEQHHADMQCFCDNEKFFVLNGCKPLINSLRNKKAEVIETYDTYSGKYPDNIRLNIKIAGSYVLGKKSSTDTSLITYLDKKYTYLDVKQGYTACSCLNVNDSIITSDSSIHKALNNTEIESLKISQENIALYGAGESTNGFIGGASVALSKHDVLFFGDIRQHKDYESIKEFCTKNNTEIHLIENLPLLDIGGSILLKF